MRKVSMIVGLAALAWTAQLNAQAETGRNVLPIPPAPFSGTIAENILDSMPAPQLPVRPPEGAPNVLLFMSDDVGFAMSSTFGGPVPTPNFDRLAAQGQRYNRFHTTGVCSPSRAALLTGRNHHAVGMGHVSDLATGYPGYVGHISREAATIAQVLRLNGYSTAMFGKHHNVPPGEASPAGPFDNWPTGLGFEYFYGFVTADTDQWEPNVVRGTNRLDPDEGNGALLDRRLADDAITWLRNQTAAAPNKPFFAYYAPGSTHVPHQAPPEYIARFKGKFDQGWDKMREETFRRQLAAGIIPKGTRLTPRPDGIATWDSLPADRRAFFARTMEVAAAQLAYQDEQFGRVLDELQRMGKLDDTLVVLIQGDNGASMEAGATGTINETFSMTGGQEDPQWLLANTDKLGGRMTYGNYPAGWAWAMDTPLRWGKMYVSVLGGIRNGMVMSWKGHVARPGSVCGQFSHLIDVAPTILDAARLPAPTNVYGVPQKPMDGQSLLGSLSACDAGRSRTQYFEVGGKIGLYHDGWFLSGDDGRMTWENMPPAGPRPQTQWTLYNLTSDFSQGKDLSAQYPDRVRQMITLWRSEAEKNQVFPLDHRFGNARFDGRGYEPGPDRHDFWGKDVSIPAGGIAWAGRSFTIDAEFTPAKPNASGVIMAVGSHFGGWSLFLDKGRPSFVYAASTDPAHIVRITGDTPLVQKTSQLRLRFDFKGFDKGADIAILAGEKTVASGHIAKLFISPSGLGETVDVGRDIGVPVTDYDNHRGAFEGDIPRVSVIFDSPRH